MYLSLSGGMHIQKKGTAKSAVMQKQSTVDGPAALRIVLEVWDEVNAVLHMAETPTAPSSLWPK